MPEILRLFIAPTGLTLPTSTDQLPGMEPRPTPPLPSPQNFDSVATVYSVSQDCQIFLGAWYQNRQNVPNEHEM
jgi:hypothetical protein